MSTPLISLDDLKAELPIRDGNDQFDEKLTIIINSVSRQIEAACRRQFVKQSYTEMFHVQAGPQPELNLYADSLYTEFERPSDVPYRLSVHPLDIADDTPVLVYYDQRRRFDDTTLIPADCWTMIEDKIYVNRILRPGRDVLKIVYTAGYEASGDPANLSETLPDDLKLAAVTQCVYVFQRTDASNVGAMLDFGTTKGAGSKNTIYQTPSGLIPDVVFAIAKYKKQFRGRG